MVRTRKCYLCGTKAVSKIISLHKFPRDERLPLWKEFCRAKKDEDMSNLHLCSRHFERRADGKFHQYKIPTIFDPFTSQQTISDKQPVIKKEPHFLEEDQTQPVIKKEPHFLEEDQIEVKPYLFTTKSHFVEKDEMEFKPRDIKKEPDFLEGDQMEAQSYDEPDFLAGDQMGELIDQAEVKIETGEYEAENNGKKPKKRRLCYPCDFRADDMSCPEKALAYFELSKKEIKHAKSKIKIATQQIRRLKERIKRLKGLVGGLADRHLITEDAQEELMDHFMSST